MALCGIQWYYYFIYAELLISNFLLFIKRLSIFQSKTHEEIGKKYSCLTDRSVENRGSAHAYFINFNHNTCQSKVNAY